MGQDEKKHAIAQSALEFVVPGELVGVGTGSTANAFIDALAALKHRIDGAVASSQATAARLTGHGIRVVDLNTAGTLPVYFDGADEGTRHRHLVKGGGGALTREKILAGATKTFVCGIDDSKLVDRLGRSPLPLEVIPMARSLVARAMVQLGGRPERRGDFITENGNEILDVYDLDILDPPAFESELNQITGIVANGLFARRGADVMLIATGQAIDKI